MKDLEQQLQGVKSDHENQKIQSQHQLEQQQKKLKEQFEQEKQRLVDIDKMNELQQQMEQMNAQLALKEENL